MSTKIAETIWSQINMNGGATPMSWGAHALKVLPPRVIDTDFDCLNGGIQFMVHGALFKGHVRVILNDMDTYDVHIGKVRKGVWTEHKTFYGIYSDVLPDVIDQTVETPDNAVTEEETLYVVEAVSDWDTATTVEVHGAVEEDGGCHIDDTRAEFYSIYVTETEGTTMVVGDYDTLPRAREAVIRLLGDHPNITEGSNSLELVPTKPL